MSNAIKFSPKGSTIVVNTTQDSANHIRVEVIDKGAGVPKDYVDKVFERFTQVRSSDGKRGKGTGLGLPICKKLIEGQNGRIGLDSVEGEGSTFWYVLPSKADA